MVVLTRRERQTVCRNRDPVGFAKEPVGSAHPVFEYSPVSQGPRGRIALEPTHRIILVGRYKMLSIRRDPMPRAEFKPSTPPTPSLSIPP